MSSAATANARGTLGRVAPAGILSYHSTAQGPPSGSGQRPGLGASTQATVTRAKRAPNDRCARDVGKVGRPALVFTDPVSSIAIMIAFGD